MNTKITILYINWELKDICNQGQTDMNNEEILQSFFYYEYMHQGDKNKYIKRCDWSVL